MKILNSLFCHIDRLINVLLVLIFILFLLLGSYAIYDTYSTYESAELPDLIKKYQPSQSEELQIEELKTNVNDDIEAWINIYDTTINYPIVQGKDNFEYLNKNYLHKYASAGSIFLDYRNSREFEDNFSIIYGHNLINNTMFGGLIKFEKKDYYDKHLSGMLHTSKGNYKIEVIAFSVLDAYDPIYNLIIYANGRNKEVYDYIIKRARNKSDLEIKANDKLLLLSTCRANAEDKRSTLLTRIVKVD